MRHRMRPMMLALATMLAACGSQEQQAPLGNELFNPIPIRKLAAQPGADPARVVVRFREMVAEFREVYRDGVGPTRNAPAYRVCWDGFDAVATVSGRPVSDRWLAARSAELRTCRIAVSHWSQNAEIATFGDDLGAVTTAALAVLACAAAHSGSPSASALYAEANAD